MDSDSNKDDFDDDQDDFSDGDDFNSKSKNFIGTLSHIEKNDIKIEIIDENNKIVEEK